MPRKFPVQWYIIHLAVRILSKQETMLIVRRGCVLANSVFDLGRFAA